MRDINARDIVGCTITEVVGPNPTLQILQQGGEVLAQAEQRSRQIVTNQRKHRVTRGALLALLTLVLWGCAALCGYLWLLQRGHITVSDLIHDSSNISIAALIATVITALAGLAAGAASSACKDPTPAEKLNRDRLQIIYTRWAELRSLGLSRKDIRQIRKRTRRQ